MMKEVSKPKFLALTNDSLASSIDLCFPYKYLYTLPSLTTSTDLRPLKLYGFKSSNFLLAAI